MTELTVLDGAPRRELLLASLRRLMEELFGDLLRRADIANLLVLPPGTGSGPCRLVIKEAGRVVPVRDLDPEQVRRFLAHAAGFARRELRRDRPTLDVVLPETGERIHADI